MTRAEDIAWAAGLFEGEGCFTISTGQRQPVVQLVTTDEDVIKRFAAAVERGNVHYYAKDNPKHKGFWRWSVQGKDDVLYVVNLLWPFLGARRRERACDVVERAAKMHDGKGYCKHGHDLSIPLNVYVHLKTGKRQCDVCRRRRQEEWNRRRRVLRPAA